MLMPSIVRAFIWKIVACTALVPKGRNHTHDICQRGIGLLEAFKAAPSRQNIFLRGCAPVIAHALPPQGRGFNPDQIHQIKKSEPFSHRRRVRIFAFRTAFCVPMQFIPSTRNRHSRLRRHFDRPGFPVWSGGTRNRPSPRTNPSTGTAIGRWSFCYTRWRFRKSRIAWMVAAQ